MIEEIEGFNLEAEHLEGLSLETDHLEQVIESPPPAQPVVVIQYRSRGVPWYLVLPLLIVVPLGAVGIYHRVVSRADAIFCPLRQWTNWLTTTRDRSPRRMPRPARSREHCSPTTGTLPWRSIRNQTRLLH